MGTQGFITGENEGFDVSKKITSVVPIECFVVTFKNAEGKEENRISFRPKGSKVVINIQPKISGAPVVTSANPWFQKEFDRFLETQKDVPSI